MFPHDVFFDRFEGRFPFALRIRPTNGYDDLMPDAVFNRNLLLQLLLFLLSRFGAISSQ